MSTKPELVFTFPACMGGVASFNYNIINHSKLIKDYYSKVILLKAEEDNRPVFTDTFIADEVHTFHYSSKENQFMVCKRLNELVGNSPGAVVTDNALTVNAVRGEGNQKTIFHLLHDYFYVNQTVQLGDLVDAVIAHSSFFSDAVYASNPSIFNGRSFYIPYGVQQLSEMPTKNNEKLKLVFLGRLDESKGVLKLILIEELLQKRGVHVDWTIIGKGPLKARIQEQWQHKHNVNFFEPASTDEVYELLRPQDLFIFPTTFEGTPVSILECLSNGVVTITHDLPGGIRDIVTEKYGDRCRLGDLEGFADRVVFYNDNRAHLMNMQRNCFNLATSSYDINKNADHYFQIFGSFESLKRKTYLSKINRSRLDAPFLPNSLVKMLRGIRK